VFGGIIPRDISIMLLYVYRMSTMFLTYSEIGLEASRQVETSEYLDITTAEVYFYT
jgi:hypothetical protein